MKQASKPGPKTGSAASASRRKTAPGSKSARAGSALEPPAPKKSAVSKVSHTLTAALAERLEHFAFFQRVSESAVIEYSLARFFQQSDDDAFLGDVLRNNGAGRRRKG